MRKLILQLFLITAVTACNHPISLSDSEAGATPTEGQPAADDSVVVVSDAVNSDTVNNTLDASEVENTDVTAVNSNIDALDSTGMQAVDVIIPRVDQSSLPVIDGALVDYLPNYPVFAGEWHAATTLDQQGNLLAIDSLMIDNTGSASENYNHHWAAVHDGTYLYLLIVSDDAGLHQSDSREVRKPWKDDDLELYFDGNNSKLDSYDGVDDFHLHVNLINAMSGEANNSYAANRTFLQAVNSANIPSDFIFANGLRSGPESPRAGAGRQDIYELRIKISELNITPGMPFGIELQLNDDDTGGTRDAKWGWSHPAGEPGADDMTWQNPSYMGTALLAE